MQPEIPAEPEQRVELTPVRIAHEPSFQALANAIDGLARNEREKAMMDGKPIPRDVIIGSRAESAVTINVSALRTGGQPRDLSIEKAVWRARGTSYVVAAVEAFLDQLEPKL